MYQEAQRHLNNRNYDLAVRTLQLLESRYPFGKYAEQAPSQIIHGDLRVLRSIQCKRDRCLGIDVEHSMDTCKQNYCI